MIFSFFFLIFFSFYTLYSARVQIYTEMIPCNVHFCGHETEFNDTAAGLNGVLGFVGGETDGIWVDLLANCN